MDFGTWCFAPVTYTVAHCYVQCYVMLRYCCVTYSALLRMCYALLTTADVTQCHFMISSSSECHKYWPHYYLCLPVVLICYLCYLCYYLCYLCYDLDDIQGLHVFSSTMSALTSWFNQCSLHVLFITYIIFSYYYHYNTFPKCYSNHHSNN